ncbi:hypothetical protein B0J17DRAFT_248921 [Rhizoctonia solani]|nr:hypothetical protein B0J17DRAFT_248921 [Rhizoctonia solani]
MNSELIISPLEHFRLARSILLFTLLEDDAPSNHIWDIFYHFKLGDHAFGLIKSQSLKLLELSESPETWRQSRYGSFLKMVTVDSLVELRQYWTRYVGFSELPDDRDLERSSRWSTLAQETTCFSGCSVHRLDHET